MRHLIITAGLFAVLAACSNLSKYTTADANASAKTKMRTCMLQEANSKFQAGTLFAKGLTATANELVTTCAKKLAIESTGITSENQTLAKNIIANFQNMGTE